MTARRCGTLEELLEEADVSPRSFCLQAAPLVCARSACPRIPQPAGRAGPAPQLQRKATFRLLQLGSRSRCRPLASWQVVSLHCSLGPATRHLIDAQRLRLMKPDALLVNTARGPVVDEQALVEHLRANPHFRAGGSGAVPCMF